MAPKIHPDMAHLFAQNAWAPPEDNEPRVWTDPCRVCGGDIAQQERGPFTREDWQAGLCTHCRRAEQAKREAVQDHRDDSRGPWARWRPTEEQVDLFNLRRITRPEE